MIEPSGVSLQPVASMRAYQGTTMAKAIRAGIAYFGVIFALGFALGVVRTLYTAP
ncbi:MAG: hypothetical protein H7267_02140, partial [Sandarakinorhabdus sp.]|nr:hypothetical protein [Sandarakinorhabdus sp.]